MSESSPLDQAKAASDKLSDLEFPIEPGFYSPPPKLSMAEYHRWCLEIMIGQEDDPEERLSKKCDVEFVL